MLHVMTAWKATWNSDENQATAVVEMQGCGGVKLPDLKMRLAFDDAGRTTLKIPRELLEGASAFSIRADFLTAKAGEPGYWLYVILIFFFFLLIWLLDCS